MSKNLFCEMAIEVFKRMTSNLPYDVYVKIGEDKFTKIFNRGDPPDVTRFENYEIKGAKNLYIMKKDRRLYINTTEKVIKEMLGQDNLSLTDAGFAIEEMTEQILFEIYEDGSFDGDLLFKTQAISKSYVKLLKENVTALTTFIKMARNETYMVRHSISTAIMSILIARADNNENDRTLDIICLGGLLHDVGMAKLPAELNETDRTLTPEEWQKVKQHPYIGARMIESIEGFPAEVKEVILQHHENFNGSGYPRAMSGEKIYYPARVVALADSFSALTTRRGGRPLFTPQQALELLISEKGKYDPKLLKAFENLLLPKRKVSA